MKNPTLKQRALATNLAGNLKDNSKKETYGSLLLKSGYSEITAKEPHKILQGKGFQELIINYGVTDEKLATRLNEGLDASKKEKADYNTRHKYLETALELKGLKNEQVGRHLEIGSQYNIVIED